jgi:hypothetical protein
MADLSMNIAGPLPLVFPPRLTVLNLQSNLLSGSLPGYWGRGGLGMLSTMFLAGASGHNGQR